MKITAMLRPTLLRVARLINSPPWPSRRMFTCGWPCSSKLAWASVTWSPVMIRPRSTAAAGRLPSRNSKDSVVALEAPGSAPRRNSRFAVLPRIRLASAVSCTPGNSTTMRLAPWRCTSGSATPSSLTRLRTVVKFCLIEYSRISESLAWVNARFSTAMPLRSTVVSSKSLKFLRISARACSRDSSSLKPSWIAVPCCGRLR
ncbi:hypothetical protein D9M71_415400 [compost metagenome]